MPFVENILVRSKDEILAAMMTEYQAAIPDVWLGEDGALRILLDVDAGQLESLWMAGMILREDMFVQTASVQALDLLGDQYEQARKAGTPSVGTVKFTGAPGIFIPVGTEIAHDPGTGEENVLIFLTTTDGTIPDAGTPAPPVVALGGPGDLLGTFEYVVSFLTAEGETIPGTFSLPITVSPSKSIDLTNIPVGGAGTTGRRVYRRTVGGVFERVTTIYDNTTTTFTDNVTTPTGEPLAVSTAHAVTVEAQSEEAGAIYNVIPNSITALNDVPNGITSVVNLVPFVGGSDEEDNEDYRTRLLNFMRSPGTGSPSDMKVWAEEIPGVDTASVFENDNMGTPTNGHVTVRISGPDGSIPTAEKVAEVLAHLESKDIANIIIHVTTFTANTQNVTVNVTPSAGFTEGDVASSVQDAVTIYINSIPVGGVLRVTGIIDAVFGLSGVDDVSVTTPGANVTAAATEKFIPGTITVT